VVVLETGAGVLSSSSLPIFRGTRRAAKDFFIASESRAVGYGEEGSITKYGEVENVNAIRYQKA